MIIANRWWNFQPSYIKWFTFNNLALIPWSGIFGGASATDVWWSVSDSERETLSSSRLSNSVGSSSTFSASFGSALKTIFKIILFSGYA